MKRRRLASAVAAAIAIPALGLGLNGAASARTISADLYVTHIVVLDCQGHAHVRPGRYTLTCADGNDYLSGLAWTSWGPWLASALPGRPPAVRPQSAGCLLGDAVPMTATRRMLAQRTGTVSYNTMTRRSELN
jgi:hypothetical protein